MSSLGKLLGSSLGKKYLMAISGFIWVGFVFGHMAGNLQIFLHPDWINAYAFKLQNLPYGLIWVIRAGLLAALIVHVVTAILLVKENRAARPDRYEKSAKVQAKAASKSMILTGLVILAFFIFHILHYTVRVVPSMEYNSPDVLAKVYMDYHGEIVKMTDVHAMMIMGFQNVFVSLFYLIAVGLLLMHLSHGVSSMFQSLGLRNHYWRGILDKAAVAYGVVVFLGFAAIPVAVLAGLVKIDPEDRFHSREALELHMAAELAAETITLSDSAVTVPEPNP